MKHQRGGFFLGMIVGLLIGLALALGVALYVTKVPVPFVNKVPSRTAEQDAAEAERNRNWDPNGGLQGKNQVRPPPPPAAASAAAAAAAAAAASAAAMAPAEAASSALPPGLRSGAARPAEARASAPESRRDPAAILSGGASEGGIVYFVQAGAYARSEEAEQQRARLGMLGFTAQVSEREQTGRTVYRVRLGPFDNQAQAQSAQEKLAGNGVEAALVRVQK